jgi:hypothetical protein
VYKKRVLEIEMTNATPSTACKCYILLSFKIDILEIQWTMLSMDMLVEEYLEMGAMGLLVWTQWLQDPLYREV